VVPRYARVFVAVFLTVLVVCAAVPVNLWPFSSWELFSRLRSDKQMSWQALAVGAAGQVRSFPIDTLAHGYQGFEFVMRRFAAEPARDRNAICAAWVEGAERRFGPGTHVVRIYRVEWRLSRKHMPPRSTLAWICGPDGARAIA
jgi:hypothetical protein